MEIKLLNREYSSYIRGIGAIFIMMGHITTQCSWIIKINFQGNLWVGLFFFYTRYGLMTSLKEKEGYLNKFIGNKFKLIYLPFLIAEIAYVVATIFVNRIHISVPLLISQCIGLNLANSTLWYVIELIVIYVVFYVLYSRPTRYTGVVWCILYALFMIIAVILDIGTWWYISTSCFLIGLFFDKIENILSIFMNSKKLCALYVVIYLFFYFSTRAMRFSNMSFSGVPGGYLYTAIDIVQAPMFLLFIAIVVQYLPIKNRIMDYIGSVSYEIYLWHMFAWLIFKDITMPINILLTIIVTMIIAMIMNKVKKEIFHQN